MRRMKIIGGILILAAGAAWASTVIGLSVEDQARLSEMIVVGEVIAQRGVSHRDNGLETAVSLRIDDVLKGRVRAGQVVTFHTRGGELNGEISEALGEAVLRSGQKVLVFIESVDGRLYNLGLSMGVWEVQEDRAGGAIFTRSVRDGLSVVGEEAVEHGPLSYDEMRSRVSYAARNPRFDNETLRGRSGQGR